MSARTLRYALVATQLLIMVGCEYKGDTGRASVTTNVMNIPETTQVEARTHTERASEVVTNIGAVPAQVTNVVEPVGQKTPPKSEKLSFTIGVRDARLEGLALLTASHGTPEQPVATWGPRDQAKYAHFTVTTLEGGPYVLWVTLASGGYHPFDVLVNDVHVLTNVCGEHTGGYDVAFAKKLRAGEIHLAPGTNTVTLRVSGSSPCIASITLER